ncbi:hypothetical protein IAT38_001234 [Cryptococcus sp. DSM 104549]
MSDAGSEADLFGGSDGSRAGSPAQRPSHSGSPAAPAPAQEEEDDDVGNDLFGDDDDEDAPPRARHRSSTGTPASGSRSRTPNPLEYAEEDEDADAAPARVNLVTLPIPQWPHMQATDGKVWQMKLPSFVNLETQPYDPDLYRANLDDEPLEGSAAKARMMNVRSTIRWKWVTGPDGEPVRRSNARMLRWSDGSVSLQVGSDFYDVAPSHGATLARPSDPTPAPKRDDKLSAKPSTTFLCVAAAAERVLVTERPIAGQLSLVPASMQSKTYLELVKLTGQQHTKHSKMKMLEETQDEASLQELLLKSAPNRELIKGAKASAAAPRRAASSKSGRSAGGSSRRARKIGYSDSEDEGVESEDERPARRRTERDDAVGYDEDDGFVVADTDDDDEYGGGKKKKGKGKGKKRKGSFTDDDDEEAELDEMEEAERRIEERERERKRARKDKGGSSKKKSRDYVDTDEEEEEEEAGEEDADGEEEMDMDMDVESEED